MEKEEPRFRGLTSKQLDQLATYNSEAARGLVHTEQWMEIMAGLQLKFDHEVLFTPNLEYP